MKRQKTTLKSWQFKSKAVKITVFLLAAVMAFASVSTIIFDDMFAEAYTLQAQGLHNVVLKDTATITAEGAVDTAGKAHDVNRLIDGVTLYTSSTEEKSVAFTENGTPYFIVDLGDLYIDINEVRLYGLRKDNTNVTKYYPQATNVSFATEKNENGVYNWVTPSNPEAGFFGWSVMNTTSYTAFDIRDEKFSFCGMTARYVKVAFTPNTYSNKLCQIELAEIEVWSYGKAKAEAPAFSEALIDKSSGNDINEAFMYYDEETGTYKNMTSVHQMAPGTKMYVAVVHKDTNMFLRQTLTGGGYYYTATPKASYMNWDRLRNHYDKADWSEGQMKYHIWVLYKDAGGAFEFRAPYEQYEPNIGTRKIALNLSATPEIKQWYSTRSEEQRFELIESKTDNGEGVTYKIFGRYSKCYINIDGGDSTAVKKAGETSLALTKNDNEADEWYILPILQNNNKDTHYGYSGASSDVDPEDRDDANYSYFYTSIKNTKTGMLLTQDLSKIKKITSGNNYYYSFFREPEFNEKVDKIYNSGGGWDLAPQQLFRLDCDGEGYSPASNSTDQFMLWTISHAGSSFIHSWGLDVDNWYQGPGNDVGIYENYNTESHNGTSSSRFFLFYSFNEDGGYYISTPSNWDSSGQGTNNVFHLAALYVAENVTGGLYGGSTHTDNYLKAGKFTTSSNYRFFISTSKEIINSTVQDVVVEQDENGNWQIIEGHAPLHTYDSVEVYYNSAFDMSVGNGAEYAGYTYVENSTHTANRITPVGYRYYRKNVYNITFNAGTLAQNPLNAQKTIKIDCEEQLGDDRFINTFKVDLQFNNGQESVTGGFVEHAFSSWVDGNGNSFESTAQLKDYVEELGLVDDGGYTFTAVWKESTRLPLPSDITRDNFVFYGWSIDKDLKPESNIIDSVVGITEDKTVYAYWLGADVEAIAQQRSGTLTVDTAVYGAVKHFALDYNKAMYEWFRVDADGTEHKVFGNTTKSYGITDADAGCILKAKTTINGVALKDAYSAVIPNNIKVDATPADSHVTESTVPTEVNVNILSMVTYFIDAPKGVNGEILPVSGIFSSTDVVYKLYGVLPDGTRVFVLNSNEVTLEELNGISKEGICFEKYAVVFSNPSEDTPLKITEDNFALLALPRLYKIEVSGGTCNVHYLVSDYVKGDRANDGVYSYYYDNDVIRIEVPVTNGSKLSAGSYIVVDGVKIYPVYSNSTGGNVVFEYINELDVLVNKNASETKQAIVFAKADKKVEINIKTESNADANEENVNIGPLGAKIWDVDNVKKIRFGSVWYLDDLVSSNRWYRDEGFGTYLVLLNNLFKYKDSTNDFYVYLTGKNDESVNSLIEKWSNKNTYPTVTDDEKKLMLGYLADFVKDWNAQKDVSKMSFGSGVANDVKAGYYYYHKGNLVDGVRKAYVEYSAVLKIPDNMVGREIIYLPYASFVKNWYYGSYNPSESTHPDSIYVFKAPEKIYTYGNVSGGVSIENIDVIHGETATIVPKFDNVKYEDVTFEYDNTLIDVKYENGVISVTAKQPCKNVQVTSKTPYHNVVFEVSTKSKLTIDEEVVVKNGEKIEVPLNFSGNEMYTVEYIFNRDAIIIENNFITVKDNRIDETVEVIAKTPYEEVRFTVKTEGAGMIVEKDVIEIVAVGNATNVTSNTVDTGISFTDGKDYPITYTFEGSDISINNATGEITAINPDKTISVTASTEYGHSKTFTVKTYELPTIKDVTVFVDNVVEQGQISDIDQNRVEYPATDYYPENVVGDISFNAFVKDTTNIANVKFYKENDVWFVDNNGELLAGNYDGKATYKNIAINFNIKAVETNKAQESYSKDGGYAWDNTKYSDSTTKEGNRTENRVTQLNEWLDSTYINGQNVRNQTTLFIGDSFFDVTEKNASWYWFPFYTSDEFYKDKNALALNIGGTTTYDWEQWITTEGGWVGNIEDTPQNIVVNLGTNNIGNIFRSSELSDLDVSTIVFEDLQRFLLVLHEKFPNTPIYWYGIAGRTYNGLFTEDETLDLTKPNTRAFNVNLAMISWCNERPWITYVDPAVGENLADGLHPSVEGYKKMKESLATAMKNSPIADRKLSDIKFTATSSDVSKEFSVFTYGDPLHKNYYVKGHMKISGINSAAEFASLEFGIFKGDNTSKMTLLDCFQIQQNKGDSEFRLCFDEAYYSTPDTHMYSMSDLDVNFMILVKEDDVYFLMGTGVEGQGEWELKLVSKGMINSFWDNSRVDLRIAAYNCDAEVTFTNIVYEEYSSTDFSANFDAIILPTADAVNGYTYNPELPGYGGWIYHYDVCGNGKYFHYNDVTMPYNTLFYNSNDNPAFSVVSIKDQDTTLFNAYSWFRGEIDFSQAAVGDAIAVSIQNAVSNDIHSYVIRYDGNNKVSIGWRFHQDGTLQYAFTDRDTYTVGGRIHFALGIDGSAWGTTHFAVSQDNSTWIRGLASGDEITTLDPGGDQYELLISPMTDPENPDDKTLGGKISVTMDTVLETDGGQNTASDGYRFALGVIKSAFLQ